MFTQTYATPASVDGTWRLRALPTGVMGQGCLEGDVRRDVRAAAAADVSFPGTRAWSPPM